MLRLAVCYQLVVNYLLRGWIKNLETQGSVSLPLLDDGENVLYNIARDLEFVRNGSRKPVRVRFFGSLIHCGSQLSLSSDLSLGNRDIAALLLPKT